MKKAEVSSTYRINIIEGCLLSKIFKALGLTGVGYEQQNTSLA